MPAFFVPLWLCVYMPVHRQAEYGFDGLLPWGYIDNRPFLRCMHGYGLCLWRLGRLDDAARIFTRLLWLNPSDNQGARFLVEEVRAGLAWDNLYREKPKS